MRGSRLFDLGLLSGTGSRGLLFDLGLRSSTTAGSSRTLGLLGFRAAGCAALSNAMASSVIWGAACWTAADLSVRRSGSACAAFSNATASSVILGALRFADAKAAASSFCGAATACAMMPAAQR